MKIGQTSKYANRLKENVNYASCVIDLHFLQYKYESRTKYETQNKDRAIKYGSLNYGFVVALHAMRNVDSIFLLY